MKQILIFVLSFAIVIGSQILSQQSLAVTIYNDNFGIVKDTRLISFDAGQSMLYFTDVAENIQTPTVTFKALNSPKSIRVYQQNFQKNLINTNSILLKFIQKQATIFVQLGDQVRKITGKLLGFNSGYIIQTQSGVQVFNKISGIQLPDLPEGFFTKPTLNWKVWSQKAQQTLCEVAYRTTGFKWSADYSLTLNKDQTLADIGGWVTIDNNSGKKYQNAKLKLIAGQVNIVRPKTSPVVGSSARRGKSLAVARPPQFVEKSFADYHMYTLSSPVTLNISSQKQVEFIPRVYEVEIQKYHQIKISAGGENTGMVQVKNKIKFKNSKQNGLGIPLPKGVVRVFKSDQQDQSLQFIGQDSIKHTPKQQNITILTGKAFDIVAQKIQETYETLNNIGGYSAQLKMRVKNHKEVSADVMVVFNNFYADNLDLKMIEGQQPQRKSASEFVWRKTLQPNEQWVFKWKQNRFN